MSDSNKPEFNSVPLDIRTPTERVQDDQIDRLEEFFSVIQPGTRLLIERLKPSWCQGLLEEIVVTEENIDLSYFIQTWGGHLLSGKIRDKTGKIRGSYLIPLYTYDPLRWGKRLPHPNQGDRFDPPSGESIQKNSPVIVQQPNPQPDILSALPALFSMFDQQRQVEMQLMSQLLANRNTPAVQPSGIQDLANLGNTFKQLQDIFRTDTNSSGDDMAFMPQIIDALKMVLPSGSSSKEPKPSKLIGPGPTTNTLPPATITPLRSPNSGDVANALTEMDPDTAAKTLLTAIGRMPAGKREEALRIFLSEFQDYQEDEDEDEEDEPKTRVK